jgi:hypothetical protein
MRIGDVIVTEDDLRSYEWQLTSTGDKLHREKWERKSMCGQTISFQRTWDCDDRNELDSFSKCAICALKAS